jgi:hypothetical protein
VKTVTTPPPGLTTEQQNLMNIAQKYGLDPNNDTHKAAVVLMQEGMVENPDPSGKPVAVVFEETFKKIHDNVKTDEGVRTVVSNLAEGKFGGLVEVAVRGQLEMDKAEIQKVIQDKVRVLTTPTETQIVVTSDDGTQVTMGRQLFEDTFNVDVDDDGKIVITDESFTPANGGAAPKTITTDKQLGEMVTGAVKGVGDFFSNLFGSFTGTVKPTDSLVTNTDSNNYAQSSYSTYSQSAYATPRLDLTVKATTPIKSAVNEYRFKGELTRTLSSSNSDYFEELQKNFSAVLENRLNIDYACNGTTDLQKTFTLPYRSFSTQESASTLFMSEYLSVPRSGSHCFFFDIDIKNAITEKSETNNQSNKFNFVVE